MRLDRFLWWARLAKTRSAAQAIAEGGRFRISGRLIEKAHCPVRVGDVLTYAAHGRVRVVRVEALPARRGPAPEAAGCYTDLSVGEQGAGSREQGLEAGDLLPVARSPLPDNVSQQDRGD